MKNTNKTISMIMVMIIFILSVASSVSATEISQNTINSSKSIDSIIENIEKSEKDKILDAIDYNSTPHSLECDCDPSGPCPIVACGNCVNCGWFIYNVCAGDAILQKESDYHTNFFGQRFDCHVFYFASSSYKMCPTCDYKERIEGVHSCWEVHEDCSKGWYDICPIGD